MPSTSLGALVLVFTLGFFLAFSFLAVWEQSRRHRWVIPVLGIFSWLLGSVLSLIGQLGLEWFLGFAGALLFGATWWGWQHPNKDYEIFDELRPDDGEVTNRKAAE